MPRAGRVGLVWLALGAFIGAPSIAFAEPRVSVEATADGTFALVGSGWRSGQHLVIGAGPDVFAVKADAVGDFEIHTGVPVSAGPPGSLRVSRQNPPALALARPDQASESVVAHPLAVSFAEAVARGTALLGLTIGGLALAEVAARRVGAKRS